MIEIKVNGIIIDALIDGGNSESFINRRLIQGRNLNKVLITKTCPAIISISFRSPTNSCCQA